MEDFDMNDIKEVIEEYKEEVFLKHILTAFVISVSTIGAIMSIASVIIVIELAKLNWMLQFYRGY